MLRNSVFAIRLGLLVSPLLIAGQVVSSSAQASPAPTVTLSASPTSIWYPESSTLTWSSANAAACSGTGKGFSPSGPSGSLAVSPYATTTYGITCTGAGGSASRSVRVAVSSAPTLAIGMTVAATGDALRLVNSIEEYVRYRLEASRKRGHGHRRSSERQLVNMVAGILRRRPYRVDLPERSDLDRSRGRIAHGADTLVQRASSAHRPRRLVDAVMVVDQGDLLQRRRLLSIARLRISLRLADREHHVQHHLHGQRRIYGSNQRR